jgi:N-acetylglucosamine-6-phosphate deacetylase
MGSAVQVTGRLVDTGELAQVRIEDGVVAAVAAGSTDADPALWLAPGLVDIQVNGYAGHDVNADDVDAATVRRLVEAEWRQGVTAFCPTVVTGPEERIVRALRAVAEARDADPLVAYAIPCVHVEGPHIASEDGPRGAHDLDHVRPPDVAEYERWQRESRGLVGIVTLAPELPCAVEYIARIAGDGVVAAIGHTAAEPNDIHAAVRAGARLSTHLGNGAHARIRRHPNYIWSQLADDRLTASFIADGHHLSADVLTVMLRAKGVERSVLVSDSVELAGMQPGRYPTPVGGAVELSADGRLSLAGTPLLAGAARSLPECVGWAVGHTELSLADAVRMASANPVRLLGLRGPAPRGGLCAGGSGDVTVLRVDPATGRCEAVATIVRGVVVHRSGDAPVVAADR